MAGTTGGMGEILGQILGAALGGGSVRRGGAASQRLPGGLEDILGQVLGGAGGRGGSGGNPGLPGGLGDILGQVLGGGAGRTGGASGLPGGLGDILGQVLGGGRSPSGRPGGAGPSGGIEDILGQILGGGPSGGSTAGGGISGGGTRGGSLGEIAADALGRGGSAPQPQGDLDPLPSPTPRHDTAPSASGGNDLMKYGGLAIIGMLAWKAFRKWQASAGGRSAFASGTPGAAFSPAAAPGGPDAFSGVLVAAMAAAAQADGEIDQDEVARITSGLDRIQAGGGDQDALAAILTTPVDPREVIEAATTPEAALQIYAASALAIRPDNAAEYRYLNGLAEALGIDPGLKAQLEAELNA
ncbi:DUF533 domain-containing protein [Xanthobacter sp. KR7-65]|uniref:tellurite resistance TerB family protein n=1 Tax=Xanthobacter sp. KR7-65 TaxID=3156612 RepID=UPI0032B47C78